MRTLKRAEKVLTRLLEATVSVCLLAIFALIVTLVFLRYVFNAGIVGANETATLLFVYSTAVGAAVAVGRGEHVAITFLVERIGPRARQTAEIGVLALVAVINGVILRESLSWIAITGGYIMPATQLPRVVAQVSVPLGCGLAIVYCLIRIATTLKGEGRAVPS